MESINESPRKLRGLEITNKSRQIKRIDDSNYEVLSHNYIRPHQGLNGKTPAEACGIKVEGKNKWITLIQNASISN